MLTDIGPGRFWLGQMRSTLRAQGYSVNTVDAYLYWAEAFVDFFQGQIPARFGPEHLDQFLDPQNPGAPQTRLKRHIAVNAVAFLVEDVAGRNLSWLPGYLKKRPELRQPDFLKRGALKAILSRLTGWEWLAAALSYGCGLTLDECLGLRIRDIEIPSRLLSIRAGEESGIRRTAEIPLTLISPLESHLENMRSAHINHFASGSPGVRLPTRVRRENPDSARSWPWQFLFPNHLVIEGPNHEKPIEPVPARLLIKSLNRAASESCQIIHFSRLTLRNSFAVHRIQEGHSPQSIREMLGIQPSASPTKAENEPNVA